MQRDNIIMNLAQSFGMIDKSLINTSDSYYDKATGTLYCNGTPMTKGKVEQAKNHFETQMKYYKSLVERGDKSALEMMINMTIAYNAINLLEESMNIQEEYKNKQ